MATAAVNLDPTQYVRINIGHYPLILQAHRDSVRIVVSALKPARNNTAYIMLAGGSEPINIPTPGEHVWALAVSDKSSLIVTELSDLCTDGHFAKSFEVDSRGNTALGVWVQDQTTTPFNVPFLKRKETTTIAADVAIDDRVVTLPGGHTAVVGDILELTDNATGIFVQSRILSIATNDLTLDQPINFAYTAAGTTAIISSDEILVDGSSTPQIFALAPITNQVGDIVHLILEIEGNGGMDATTLGADPALTNGCVFRIKNSAGGYHNLFNFRSNGDLIHHAFNHQYLLPKEGNTVKSIVTQLRFGGQSEHGVVVRLDGSLNEELQLVIQDNLTTGLNIRFKLTGVGHLVQ